MSKSVLSFDEIVDEQRALAGGKGGSLARLFQAGFPVPPGFVILPAAFDGEGVTPQVWVEVQQYLDGLRSVDPRHVVCCAIICSMRRFIQRLIRRGI